MLFGTFYLPRQGWPTRYGIDRAISPNMAAQLLNPLLRDTDYVPNPALHLSSTDKAAVSGS